MTPEAMIFEVEQVRFGVWTKDVKQVLRAVAISKLAGGPPLVEGIINLHGQIVAVLDFRQLLQLPAKALDVTDQLIVVELDGHDVAIRVDRALDLITLDPEGLEETRLALLGMDYACTLGTTPFGLIQILDTACLGSPIARAVQDECVVPDSAGDTG